MLFAFRPSSVKRLLIIEDDPLIAFDNERTLMHHGYDVIATVDRGEDAVRYLADGALDALVLDIHLAGHMTGRDVARLARDRHIPVLLVTAYCPDDAADIAMACLHKPYSSDLLLHALRGIETIITKNRLPRKIAGIDNFWQPKAA